MGVRITLLETWPHTMLGGPAAAPDSPRGW